jgi:hypothetical protein
MKQTAVLLTVLLSVMYVIHAQVRAGPFGGMGEGACCLQVTRQLQQ